MGVVLSFKSPLILLIVECMLLAQGFRNECIECVETKMVWCRTDQHNESCYHFTTPEMFCEDRAESVANCTELYENEDFPSTPLIENPQTDLNKENQLLKTKAELLESSNSLLTSQLLTCTGKADSLDNLTRACQSAFDDNKSECSKLTEELNYLDSNFSKCTDNVIALENLTQACQSAFDKKISESNLLIVQLNYLESNFSTCTDEVFTLDNLTRACQSAFDNKTSESTNLIAQIHGLESNISRCIKRATRLKNMTQNCNASLEAKVLESTSFAEQLNALESNFSTCIQRSSRHEKLTQACNSAFDEKIIQLKGITREIGEMNTSFVACTERVAYLENLTETYSSHLDEDLQELNKFTMKIEALESNFTTCTKTASYFLSSAQTCNSSLEGKTLESKVLTLQIETLNLTMVSCTEGAIHFENLSKACKSGFEAKGLENRNLTAQITILNSSLLTCAGRADRYENSTAIVNARLDSKNLETTTLMNRINALEFNLSTCTEQISLFVNLSKEQTTIKSHYLTCKEDLEICQRDNLVLKDSVITTLTSQNKRLQHLNTIMGNNITVLDQKLQNLTSDRNMLEFQLSTSLMDIKLLQSTIKQYENLLNSTTTQSVELSSQMENVNDTLQKCMNANVCLTKRCGTVLHDRIMWEEMASLDSMELSISNLSDAPNDSAFKPSALNMTIQKIEQLSRNVDDHNCSMNYIQPEKSNDMSLQMCFNNYKLEFMTVIAVLMSIMAIWTVLICCKSKSKCLSSSFEPPQEEYLLRNTNTEPGGEELSFSTEHEGPPVDTSV